jgi:hypothetical protein
MPRNGSIIYLGWTFLKIGHPQDYMWVRMTGVIDGCVHKKLFLDTPQLAEGRKGASPGSGLNLIFFDA